jgi:hypothetical protein
MVVNDDTHGFQPQGSYTWSKDLDEVNGEGGVDTFELQLPTNNQLDLRHSSYGLANDDRDQRAVVSFVRSTPKLASAPKAVRYALTGWQFSGIALIQSGAALSVFDGNAGSVYGLLGGEVRAELAPGGHPSTHGSLFSCVVNTSYLNPDAFIRALEVANRTSITDEDFGVFLYGEARALCFGQSSSTLTNTPQFGDPNTSLGYGNPLLPAVANPGFGLITSAEGGPHPHVVQFAAKFLF